MRAVRSVAAIVASALVVTGAVLVAPAPAGADGTTAVPITCTGIPLVGTTNGTANVTATDSVDPVAPGGQVVNTINVPVPITEVPIEATVKEVKLTLPVPSGVTVNGVTFSASSFSSTSWSVSGSNLLVTLTGNIPIGGSNPLPTVPNVAATTTVTGAPRTISWKVPSRITAKATYFLGNIDAICTPDDLNQVLLTTTVAPPNRAPVAIDQTLAVRHAVTTPVTFSGTDADGDVLNFDRLAAPAHGTLTHVAEPGRYAYTPDVGYVGPDSFDFIVGDGSGLFDIGTITVDVTNAAPVATDAAVPVPFGTATPVTLAGADADGNALTYAVTGAPAHGTLAGTAPNLTYSPAVGYVGPDAIGFTASDGKDTDAGTVTLTVAPGLPAAPVLAAPVAGKGSVALSWTAPAANGSPLTGYRIEVTRNGVPQAPVVLTGTATSTTITGLTNGASYRFSVAATNGVGTGPASAPSAAVTPVWWLPWSSGAAAVNDLYTWFTGKAPTATQRSAALASLNAGTTVPGDLVAALRTGPDATANVDPATRLYAAYFVRIPDAGGLDYWIGKRRNGANLNAMSSSFASSREFKNRYGTLTNRAFVELVYRNVLGRPGDPAGIASWTKKLDQKTRTRGQVMVGFSESNEYKTGQVRNLHAAVTSIHLLGRAPTLTERDAFVALLAGGTTLAQAVEQLIASPELPARAN